MSWLKDKTIVITGGGGVLCSTIAKGLANQGAKIVLLNRTLEKAEKIAEEIKEKNNQAMALQCNVLSVEDCQEARETILKTYGKCDILINGAGGNQPGASTSHEKWQNTNIQSGEKTFFDLSLEDIQSVFNLNFMGTLIPTQIFAQDMVDREGCSIINISSMGAFAPMTKGLAYCAAKAAVNNLTKWLAVYFSTAKIRVNAIAPGFFSTEQNKYLLWNEDGSPTERTKNIISHTPQGRLGEPQDLVGTAIWLCDYSLSSFVTGTIIPVDGGFMAYSGV